jgi:hypothetical protein
MFQAIGAHAAAVNTVCIYMVLSESHTELFPYLDFIRSTYNSFGKYQDDIGDLANVGLSRLIPMNRIQRG